MASGGILIAGAIAFVPMTATGSDISIAPPLKMILDFGTAASSLPVPVLAGDIAFGIADRPGLEADARSTLALVVTRAKLALGAGLHPIEVRSFQRDFVAGLELDMDGPAASLGLVPAERLFHLQGASPSPSGAPDDGV